MAGPLWRGGGENSPTVKYLPEVGRLGRAPYIREVLPGCLQPESAAGPLRPEPLLLVKKIGLLGLRNPIVVFVFRPPPGEPENIVFEPPEGGVRSSPPDRE